MSNRAAIVIALVVAFVSGLTFVDNTVAFLLTLTVLVAWVSVVIDLNAKRAAVLARREHRLSQQREERTIRN